MTPMMEQYLQIKRDYQNYILFYRLGDFYEMFFEDAITASRVLDLVLTGRDCGEVERAPMCGIPYHASEGYIGKLIKAGYKVAICEQVEDPKTAKGLVKRDVIRVVTQGTLVESDLLNEAKNNYLCSICFSGTEAALAFADVSCASLCATVLSADGDLCDKIINEISTFCPSEIIMNENIDRYQKLGQFIRNRLGAGISDESGGRFDYTPCSQIAIEQFGADVIGENVKNVPLISAIGGALSYLAEVHRSRIPNIKELRIYKESQYVDIDANTRRSLELCEAMRTGLYTYVAHPDLNNYSGDVDEYVDAMRPICEVSMEPDTPLEINLLGIRGRRSYPKSAFWKMVGEYDCKVVCGSDAHSPDEILCRDDFKTAMEMVDRYGLNYTDDIVLKPVVK